MSPKTHSGFPASVGASAAQSASSSQFDTFENRFFEQGDAGAPVPGEAEKFDDLDEGHRPQKWSPSRQFFLGVAVGSLLVAVIGCVVLWFVGGRGRTSEPAAVAQAEPAPIAAQAEPVPAPAARAEPIPAPTAPVVMQAEPVPTAPAPALPAPAAAIPAELAPSAAKRVPSAAPAPSGPVVVEPPAKPAPVVAPPAVELPVPKVAVSAALAASAQSDCRKAMRAKRNKQILSVCAKAFAADPGAADIAVALAKIEFDRGRFSQALAWGRKAIAADSDAADAYVFIGAGEQQAGHAKPAKEAYTRYLQLAPGGRYARDVRAIVRGL